MPSLRLFLVSVLVLLEHIDGDLVANRKPRAIIVSQKGHVVPENPFETLFGGLQGLVAWGLMPRLHETWVGKQRVPPEKEGCATQQTRNSGAWAKCFSHFFAFLLARKWHGLLVQWILNIYGGRC